MEYEREVEVRVIRKNSDGTKKVEPTKVKITVYDIEEHDVAFSKAVKGRIDPRNPQVDFDPTLYNRLRVVAAIVSPSELKSLEGVGRIHKNDFEQLLAQVDELMGLNPLGNGVSSNQ